MKIVIYEIGNKYAGGFTLPFSDLFLLNTKQQHSRCLLLGKVL